MVDWLRLLLMMFYAPVRALGDVRDRATLTAPALIALLSMSGFLYFILRVKLALGGSWVFFVILFYAAGGLLLVALVFTPFAVFISNVFERRGSYKLVMQQEYVATASAFFYALATACITVIPLVLLARLTGLMGLMSRLLIAYFEDQRNTMGPEFEGLYTPAMFDPQALSVVLSLLMMLMLFSAWAVAGVRAVFRLSWFNSIAVVFISGAVMFMASPLVPIFSALLASPFLLLIIFLLVRGYIGELNRNAQARADFKRNLEAATLNPADASAHYNLGLIHQQRGELNEARARFQRAVEIDSEEVDAHYQLGRIARSEGKLADAIKNFQEVVERDEVHSQHEIWREIGATYLAAEQFDDAREALSRFLQHRQSDPEGLYLMGRAFAGMGRKREAAYSMYACIEAVKTAPAYKYRTEKRWLNEAQQFLKQLQTTGDNLQATN